LRRVIRLGRQEEDCEMLEPKPKDDEPVDGAMKPDEKPGDKPEGKPDEKQDWTEKK
jgi:hypothetical protein